MRGRSGRTRKGEQGADAASSGEARCPLLLDQHISDQARMATVSANAAVTARAEPPRCSAAIHQLGGQQPLELLSIERHRPGRAPHGHGSILPQQPGLAMAAVRCDQSFGKGEARVSQEQS